LYEKSKNIQTEIPLGVKVILLNKSHYGQFGIVHAYINKSNHSNYSQLNEKNYNKINYDEQFNYDLTKDDYFKNNTLITPAVTNKNSNNAFRPATLR